MIDLCALILTYNEKENIARTLEALRWVPRVLIVDSYSDDGTTEIARGFANVELVQHEFRSFAQQCNFGLDAVAEQWVFSLDADYLVTSELAAEVEQLTPATEVAGYSVSFIYNVFGRRLRNTVYPNRTVLYRRELARYRDEGHGHRVEVRGVVHSLSGKIDHDDRKPLSRWLRSQDAYTKIESRHLLAAAPDALSFQDRSRLRIWFAAPAMAVYLLFKQGLILDGWPGWYYVAQRTIAELLLSIRLLTEREKLEG